MVSLEATINVLESKLIIMEQQIERLQYRVQAHGVTLLDILAKLHSIDNRCEAIEARKSINESTSQLVAKMVNEILRLSVQLANAETKIIGLEAKKTEAEKGICAFQLPGNLDQPLPQD